MVPTLVVPMLVSEEQLRSSVGVLVRLVEAAGALVIFLGALLAFVQFVTVGLRRGSINAALRVRG